ELAAVRVLLPRHRRAARDDRDRLLRAGGPAGRGDVRAAQHPALMEDRGILDHKSTPDIDGRVARIAAEFRAGFEAVGRIDRSAVTIFGSARTHAGERYYEAARATGAGFAEAGWAVVTGGGPGIMEAANRGAQEAGGLSIGFN